MTEGVPAVEYHERTKHDPNSIGGVGLNFDNKPRPDKIYRGLDTVELSDHLRPPQQPTLTAIAGPGPPFENTDRTDRSSEARPSGLDLDALTQLCYYAAGITRRIRRRGQEFKFRAAACTGALYHIDLYPVVGSQSGLETGIDPGVYHFDPRTRSLDVLRRGDYRGMLAEAAREPAVESAPVTVVATSTWWRNAWKYGDRTYRHAFWDSGTMLANLLATANALDLPARVVMGFADQPVADLLGIDPEWEAPLELVPVGRGGNAPDTSGATGPADTTDTVGTPGEADESTVDPIDPQTEPLTSDPTEYPLIYQGWKGSTLPDGSTAREWRTGGPRPVDGRGPGDGDRVELDPVDPETASNRPLHNTVRRRGSCRSYVREDLSFRKVSTVLDRATRGVPMDVSDSGDEGNALQFVDCYCIVNGVDGVQPGGYQYHPDDAELEQLRAGECRREAGHLALDQQLAADAAVCLYFLADLEAVTDALGDRGYRAAQLEGALTAGRLYLATYAHRDLGGTGLTFYDDVVTEFFEPRAAGQTPMFLYTLGRPS